MTLTCEHLPAAPWPAATTMGCAECLETGGRWVHLRICLGCGHVGCCDSSPGRHAAQHFRQTGHPVIRSFESGEEWGWCFVHDRELGPLPLEG